MSFFNVEITNDEVAFSDTLPALRDFFVEHLKEKLTDKDSCIDFAFHQVVGYQSPKGQCYEVTYRKTAFGMYGRNTYTAYMECHVGANGNLVLDNFDFG